MTNESILQKVIYVIRKEKQAIALQLWEKEKFLGYLSALDFIQQRIIDMQKDLDNERIESISIDTKYEIKKAYEQGYSDGIQLIIDSINAIEYDAKNESDTYYADRFKLKD